MLKESLFWLESPLLKSYTTEPFNSGLCPAGYLALEKIEEEEEEESMEKLICEPSAHRFAIVLLWFLPDLFLLFLLVISF